MRIIRLELENFRNFYGRHSVEFSCDTHLPITLLVGENGAGKTTLMNAIHWVLTDSLTSRLSNPDLLMNKDAIQEGKSELKVRLELLDDLNGTQYRIQRTRYKGKSSSELTVHKIKKDGVSENVPTGIAKDYLSKVFPETLARWFIFDGEALGEMGLDGNPQFKNELQQAFGFLTLRTLISDLGALLRKYQKEESSQSNNSELQEIELRIEQNETMRDRVLERSKELGIQLKNEEQACEEYRQQLQGMERSGGLETKRGAAKARQSELSQKIALKEESRRRLLEDSTAALMMSEIAEALDEKFSGREQNQSLPAPYGDRLIEDIRKSQLCVCGRPVHPGSDEETQILRLLDTAGTSILNHRISVIRSSLTNIQNTERDFQTTLDQLNADINDFQVEIAEQKQIETDMTERIRNIDVDKVRELEQKRLAAELRVKQIVHENGAVSVQLSETKIALERYIERRKTIVNQLKRDTEIARKISKLERVLRFVESEFNRQEREVLSVISDELSDVLTRYFTKHFKATVDPTDYRVDVFDIDGRPAALSTGEWLMVKFAFIATIVGMAAKNTKISKVNWISEPVVAPLVLDAPFSALDPEYRANTAINLASNVEQLILMTNSDAWNGDLKKRLVSKIGKRYLILSHAKGPALATEKSIVIDDKKYALNFYNSERDESRIQEI